jgi:hypothetical protein
MYTLPHLAECTQLSNAKPATNIAWGLVGWALGALGNILHAGDQYEQMFSVTGIQKLTSHIMVSTATAATRLAGG